MYLTDLNGTCSMYEINSFELEEIKEMKTIKNFYDHISSNNSGESLENKSIKCLILNINKKYNNLLKVGFKQINSYIGNNTDFKGKPKRVYCYMINITNKMRRDYIKQTTKINK